MRILSATATYGNPDLMTTVAEKIADLAAQHGIDEQRDQASWIVKYLSRYESISVDETIYLIDGLMRSGAISNLQAVDLIVAHYRETYPRLSS